MCVCAPLAGWTIPDQFQGGRRPGAGHPICRFGLDRWTRLGFKFVIHV